MEPQLHDNSSPTKSRKDPDSASVEETDPPSRRHDHHWPEFSGVRIRLPAQRAQSDQARVKYPAGYWLG